MQCTTDDGRFTLNKRHVGYLQKWGHGVSMLANASMRFIANVHLAVASKRSGVH